METGDILRNLREEAGYTVQRLSELTAYKGEYIRQVENKKLEPDQKYVDAVKKALKLPDNMIISKKEVTVFMRRLQEWEDAVRLRDLGKAMEINEQFQKSGDRMPPFDSDASYRYKFCLARYYSFIDNYKASSEILFQIDPSVLNKDLLYKYHQTNACYLMSVRNYTKALEHLLSAERVQPDVALNDVPLQSNLVNCYTALDMVMQAMICAERLGKIDRYLVEGKEAYYYKIVTAKAYLELGYFTFAEKMLEEALEKVSENNDVKLKAIILNNIGDVCLRKGIFDVALDYFEEADTYYSEEEIGYKNNMLYKTYTLFEADELTASRNMMEKGISLTDESTVVGLFFRAFKCSLELNNSESLSYLEDVLIPKLIEKGKKIKIIEYCDILINFYQGKGVTDKVLKYTKLSNDLLKSILYGKND